MIAPVMPFLTEKVHQNMVRAVRPDAPESVHHGDYPAEHPEWRDQKLADEMSALSRITHLALSARETAKLRVRQPLARISIGPQSAAEAKIFEGAAKFLMENLNVKAVEVLAPGTANPAKTVVRPNFKTLGKKLGPKMKAFADWTAGEGSATVAAKVASGEVRFALDFEGAGMEFSKEDFTVTHVSPEGTHVAADAFNWISLDTRITPELEREGMMRDILRKLQMTRRDVGLEIEDRCAVVYHAGHETLARVMNEWRDTIMEELLCTRLEEGDPGEGAVVVKIGAMEMRVRLQKA
jgi:isoleucyl-tRNA synthetase